ncbi:ankyrin repeat protein [Medicago truncatula]|uniref:Ankyrin repeat protein n=1 Tax=Medicago truncatula TaxID=3880 RepID=A0A072VJ13_MEDTR|nr:ankyrin repeat protein [Medicago truncatula]
MNTNGIYCFNRLKGAAEAGDIDLLYTVIQDDPYILERIDLIPFVETPLHTAASMGHLQFATEIMNLKPSYAWKLNQQGFSPIHLAMQNGQKSFVSQFVNINKELVRVQGREGLTALHFASQIGEVDLLAKFLLVCPNSIRDVTVRCETALHIAIKNEQYEALQVLVGWLETNKQRGAVELENGILNKRDDAGNTILHVSALSIEPQKLLLLLSTGINFEAKNLENKTALDIASTPKIKSILLRAGAKSSMEVADAPTLAHMLRSKKTTMYKLLIQTIRIRSDMTEEQRNIWLIVAALIATTMYESALTPPGGVYPSSAGDNSLNITSSNSTISSTQGNVGKSVLSEAIFCLFSVSNMLSFYTSITTIIIMTSSVMQCMVVYMLIMSAMQRNLIDHSKNVDAKGETPKKVVDQRDGTITNEICNSKHDCWPNSHNN